MDRGRGSESTRLLDQQAPRALGEAGPRFARTAFGPQESQPRSVIPPRRSPQGNVTVGAGRRDCDKMAVGGLSESF